MYWISYTILIGLAEIMYAVVFEQKLLSEKNCYLCIKKKMLSIWNLKTCINNFRFNSNEEVNPTCAGDNPIR